MTNKILWARQYLGLPSGIVSQLTNIELTRLEDIEAGSSATDEELCALSGLYKFSPEYLLGQEVKDLETKTLVLPRAAAALSNEDEQELEWFTQFLVAAGRRKS